MRKSLILMLIATLLVGAFLVSCNSDITSESSNGDKLVKVTIAGNSKGISAIAGGDDADNYFWYYKASKNDTSVYRTGETVARTGDGTTESPYTNGAGGWTPVKKDSNGAIAGLSGADLGYFSTGDWLFSFAGFTEQVTFNGDTATGSSSQTAVTSAYYQSNLSVGVTAETHITVTLTAGTGLSGTATLVFAEGLDWVYTPENKTNAAATLAALSGKSAYMLVYASEETDATPIAQSVPVTVALDNNDNPTKASVTFASFAPYGETAPTVSAPVTVAASPEGIDYTFYFKVFVNNEGTEYQEVSTEVYTQSVKAYSNGTIVITKTGDAAVVDNESIKKVYIDGSYLPEIGAYSAKGSKEITVNSTTSPEVVFETSITPVSTEVTTVDPQATDNKKTTVSFPAGSFVDSEATTDTAKSIEMEVVIYKTEEAATNSTFTVSGGNTFAGLDLSVDLITTITSGNEETTTTESVSSFNNQPVTVTTYIAKNLTTVTVANGAGTTGANPQVESYDPTTGKLVFTTTHFSEFAVGADQNIYDKTTNTGYIIASTGVNKGKYVTDKTGDTLLTAVPSITDELLLLKSDLANVVDDAYDAFNAGYKWSVVHSANEAAPAECFAGGYGTKIEPYIIASREQMQNVSRLYTDKYNYFKVDSSKFTNKMMDCSEWTSVRLYGSFNGDGIVFNNTNTALFASIVGVKTDGTSYSGNAGFYDGSAESFNNAPAITVRDFTVNANMRDASATTTQAGVVRSFGTNITFKNIVVSGYIQGYIAAGIGAWGAYQYGDTKSRNPYYESFRSNITFDSCTINATLVAVNERTAGLVNHPYCNVANSTFIVKNTTINSEMYTTCGTTARPETYMYNYQSVNLTVYVDGVKVNHPYQVLDKSHKISADNPALNAPEKGTVFSIEAIQNAHHATYALIIAPNPGSMVGTYVSELVSLVDDNFTSNNVKHCDVKIYDNDDKQSGYNSDSTIYEVYNSAYDGTSNGQFVQVVQFDENNNILAISKLSLNCIQ